MLGGGPGLGERGETHTFAGQAVGDTLPGVLPALHALLGLLRRRRTVRGGARGARRALLSAAAAAPSGMDGLLLGDAHRVRG